MSELEVGGTTTGQADHRVVHSMSEIHRTCNGSNTSRGILVPCAVSLRHK